MITEQEIRNNTVIEVAKLMAIAARTAPKGRGTDFMEIAIASGNDIKVIAEKMKLLAIETGVTTFNRDAENVLVSEAILILGTRIHPMRIVKCGMCGFDNCTEKEKFENVPCVFNTGDLGIAIGSAVSVAKNHCVDNRIMYTVGQAAKEIGYFNEDIKVIYGIPLSVSSKSPFFDRTHK